MTEKDLQSEMIEDEEQVEVESLEDVMNEDSAEESMIASVDAKLFAQLKKRNQQFLIAVDKGLTAANLTQEIRTAIFTEMTETLLDGQISGQTARQLYGTPTECVETILKQQFPTEEEAERSPDWQIAIDGSFILGSVFTLMTGLTLMRGQEAQGFAMGIITLILNYIAAGFAMLMTSRVLPNLDAPKGKKGYLRYFLISTLSIIVWVAVVSFSSLLIPPSINFLLPYEVYLFVGAVTLALRFYLKKKWRIRGGLF